MRHCVPGGSGPDCAGTLLSRDDNLITDLTGCTLTGATAHNLIGRDPLLGPLRDNGGGTWTHVLLAGSPAIERGDNATCAPADQRGVPRPQGRPYPASLLPETCAIIEAIPKSHPEGTIRAAVC